MFETLRCQAKYRCWFLLFGRCCGVNRMNLETKNQDLTPSFDNHWPWASSLTSVRLKCLTWNIQIILPSLQGGENQMRCSVGKHSANSKCYINTLGLPVWGARVQVFEHLLPRGCNSLGGDRLGKGTREFNLGAVVGLGHWWQRSKRLLGHRKHLKPRHRKYLWLQFSKALPGIISGPCREMYTVSAT